MSVKILVVDDEASIREMVVKLLKPEGYELVTAVNGIEALQRVEMEMPDLILLDVSMSPGPDGYEVCQQLKSDKRTALIPVTFLTAQDDTADHQRGLDVGADDYLTKPINQDLLRARVRSQLRIKKLTDQLEPAESVVFMLARAIESRFEHASWHLRRLADYSEQLASAAGVSQEDLIDIRYGAILHDIGMIRIDEAILHKPRPLSPDEFKLVKRHPEYGAEIIAPMRFASRVGPIVLGHHERWDGWGYPQGLRGNRIPIGARIVSIVDAFDAMTTERPYRRALSQQEAVRRLRAKSGVQWDSSLVNLFCSMLEQNQLTMSSQESYQDGPEKYIL